ncbi:MAG: LysM peptidoglycan-binding domain-containing protein, partial [bacterium]
MLLWCLHSLRDPGAVDRSRKELLSLSVSAKDLRGIYRVLTQRARGAAPFTGTQVADFLRRYFRIVIATRPDKPGQADGSVSQRPTVAIFPMIPELRVEASVTLQDTNNNPYELLHYAATFDEQTIVPLGYHEEIVAHFEQVASEFRTEVEKAADQAAADPPPQLAEAGGRSIAEFVFEDYFLLIARGVIQSSLDLMAAYSDTTIPHPTTGDDTIAGLSARYGIAMGRIAWATADAEIQPGVEILLGGGTTTLTLQSDTFAAIAERFGQPPDARLMWELARANAFVPNLLAVGQQIDVDGVKYTVQPGDTLHSVSKALDFAGGVDDLALAIASLPGYLNKNVRLLVPVNGRRLPPDPTLDPMGDPLLRNLRVADIANRYYGPGAPTLQQHSQFARDLGALNAYTPSLLRPMIMLRIRGEEARYTVRPDDTLASIAAGLAITPMDILQDNPLVKGIFTSAELLAIAPTTRVAQGGETLQSVAMEQNVPWTVVAENNATTRGFFAIGQILSLTRGPIDNVQTLLTALLEKKKLRPKKEEKLSELHNLSGMASRFMLPGIRLPKPTTLAEDVRGLWPNNEPAPLYALTGQQFALPTFRSRALLVVPGAAPAGQPPGAPQVQLDPKYVQLDIDLTLPERGDIAPWYEFAGDQDAPTVTMTLNQADLLWIEQIRAEHLNVELEPFRPIEVSYTEPRRFPLAQRVGWRGREPKFSCGNHNQSQRGHPTMWTLSEGLRQALSQPRTSPLALTLGVVEPASDRGQLIDHEACDYSWATVITVTIRKVVLSRASSAAAAPGATPASAAPPAPAYEIDGVDAEGALLLEDILRKAKSDAEASFIEEIHVLCPSPGADGTLELTSAEPTDIRAFILLTNAPAGSAPESTTVANLFAEKAGDKRTLLRVLWQTSITRSGGCYLYYRQAGREVLPESIFGPNGTGKISLVVTFSFKSPSDFQGPPEHKDKGVPSFVNCAVVGEATTPDTKLFATSLNWSVTQPRLPPGHTGFVVEREQPAYRAGQPGDPTPQQQLQFLYSLLGCRVAENGSFSASIEVPADGPEGAELKEKNAPAWQYTKVIPAFKFSKAPLTSPDLRPLPDPFRNPYRGIGQPLQVRFDWFDGFGNKTLPAWSPGMGAVRGLVPAPKEFEIALGYTDELIGVERWPGVSAGYSVRKRGEPEIYVRIDFDVSRYTPSATGQRTVAEAKKVAQADLEVFRKIYYQLTWGDTKVWLHTTLDPANTAPVDSHAVVGFVSGIIRYLSLIAAPEYTFQFATFQPTLSAFATTLGNLAKNSDVSAADLRRLNPGLSEILVEDTVVTLPKHSVLAKNGERLGELASRYQVSFVELQNRNPNLAGILTKDGILTQDAVLVLPAIGFTLAKQGEHLGKLASRYQVGFVALQKLNPHLAEILNKDGNLTQDAWVALPDQPDEGERVRALALPQGFELSRSVSALNTNPLFSLSVKLQIERPTDKHIDTQFKNAPGLKFVAHELEPLSIVAGNGGRQASGAIRDFAQTFEGVFPATKLATGLSRASDADSDSRNRLWVVRMDGEKGISYKVDDRQQYFFAPTPLATTLLSGTNIEGTESYAGIDLDAWARRFLSAIDTFFLPQYAVPAYVLAPKHYATIIEAKRDIAGFIADSVEGIAEGTGGDLGQAQELLRQRMLVRLSSAYEVDTIVQIGVLVESPFDFVPESAPKFYG